MMGDEELYRRVVRTDGHGGHWYAFEPAEERTCTVERNHGDWCELSCGHSSDNCYDLHYCYVCGAKVVRE